MPQFLYGGYMKYCHNLTYFFKTNFILTFATQFWKRVRVAEGARLESVCMGNCTVSSNLTVSANKREVQIIAPLFCSLVFVGILHQ